MPTPDQKPPQSDPLHDAKTFRERALHRLAQHATPYEQPEEDSRVLREVRHLRAEVAELRRALLPDPSGLIVGAEAAAEFRRLTRSR